MISSAGQQKMHFELELDEDGDWPPVSVETMWVEPLDQGLYRLHNVPFFAKGVARDDILSGDIDDEGVLRFTGVAKRGEHSTIQVIAGEETFRTELIDELLALGCSVEGSAWSALFTVDIPSREQHRSVRGRLVALYYEERLEFVDGTNDFVDDDPPSTNDPDLGTTQE